MRYRLREKIFSFRDRFVIRDESDRELYVVEGRFWSLGKKLTLSDMRGIQLAFLEQKLWNWRPTFLVHREGARTARVRRMFLPLFKHRFEIQVPGQALVVVSGNFWGYEFEFLRGGELIGRASKKFFSWADSYGIELDHEEDQVLLLAAAVIIDLVNHMGAGSSGD